MTLPHNNDSFTFYTYAPLGFFFFRKKFKLKEEVGWR